jgi:hypothetical protein
MIILAALNSRKHHAYDSEFGDSDIGTRSADDPASAGRVTGMTLLATLNRNTMTDWALAIKVGFGSQRLS